MEQEELNIEDNASRSPDNQPHHVCDICAKRCKSKGGLTMPRNRKHPGECIVVLNEQVDLSESTQLLPYSCFESCGRSFKRQALLSQRRRRAHPAKYNAAKMDRMISYQDRPWTFRQNENLIREANKL